MQYFNSNPSEMEPPSWWKAKRKDAAIIADMGGFDIYKGEVNPLLTEWFLENHIKPDSIVWDAFAGSGNSIAIGKRFNIDVIAQDIYSTNHLVIIDDSTRVGPTCDIDGAILHPPYYGSSVFSESSLDIAQEKYTKEYMDKIEKTINLALNANAKTFCIVARVYHANGIRVSLDWWLSSILLKNGFKLKCMASSVPDMAIVLER